MLLHNKLPCRERLHRVGIINNPNCDICPGPLVCKVKHFFCSCVRVATIWSWIKIKVFELVGVNITDEDLIKYSFPASNYQSELTWLLTNYFENVWKEIFVRGEEVMKMDKFFGYLTFKHRMDKQGAKPYFCIPGLI